MNNEKQKVLDLKQTDLKEFKQTEIGRIPKGWEVVRLKEVIDLLRNGLVTKQNKDEKGIPVTRIETISDERIDTQKIGYIEKISEEEISEYKLQKGDILFSHINSLAHIGKTAIYDGEPSLLLHGMNLLLLRPKRTIIKPFYLLYLLRFYRTKAIFRHMSKKAVNQASINQTELGKLRIPLPPLPEQQKIAEILSTVDKAIEKTDQAIERTQRLKKGLMQELLTKGIGHKEFKKTEIGKIPKEWEVVRIKNIGQVFTGKTPPTLNSEYWSGEIPFITPADMKKFKYVYKTERYVTSKGAQQVGILPKDTVLVVCIGSTIGKTGMTYTESITNQQINAILSNEKADLHYVYYSISFRSELLKSYSGIAAVPIIKKSLFEQFKLPLPPLPEQQKIAEILSTVDKRLELLRNKKEKLERIKRGLMNDLLTGKVRVTNLIS